MYKPGIHKVLVKSTKIKDKQGANSQASSKASINSGTVNSKDNYFANKAIEHSETSETNHRIRKQKLKTILNPNTRVKSLRDIDQLQKSQELIALNVQNQSHSEAFSKKKKGGKYLWYLLLLFSSLLLFIGIVVLVWEGALGLLFAIPALFLGYLAVKGWTRLNDSQFDKVKLKKLLKPLSIVIAIMLLALWYSSTIF